MLAAVVGRLFGAAVSILLSALLAGLAVGLAFIMVRVKGVAAPFAAAGAALVVSEVGRLVPALIGFGINLDFLLSPNLLRILSLLLPMVVAAVLALLGAKQPAHRSRQPVPPGAWGAPQAPAPAQPPFAPPPAPGQPVYGSPPVPGQQLFSAPPPPGAMPPRPFDPNNPHGYGP
ncbi:hypothetical protein [Actinomadura macrotermitis]|nr:hypothetical protein [Actinomadura macrotermitis]